MRIRQVRSVGLAVLVLGGALFAQLRHEAGNDAFRDFLNLTGGQATSIDAELTAMQQRCETLYADLAKVRARCEAAISAGDSGLLGLLTLEAKSIEDQVRAERHTYRERVQALLTPAQAEKLKLAQEVVQMMRDNPGTLESLLVDEPLKRAYHPGELLRHAPVQVHVREK